MLGEIGIIYIIGSVLGILGGSIFIHLFEGVNIDLFVSESLGDKLEIIAISPDAVKLALIMGLGSVLAAGIKAALIAGNISPIEAMQKSTQDKGIGFKEKECWIEKILSIPNKISYKNLMRNRKALFFTAVTMTIGCSIYMVGSFQGEMFDRDRAYYNNMYKTNVYEFTLNVNDISPMKQAYSSEDIEDLKKMPQVEDVLGRGLLFSRIEFPTTFLNANYGKNYLKKMQKQDTDIRIQDQAPIEGKNGFVFESADGKEISIRSAVWGLSEDELKPLEKNLVAGRITDTKSRNLQAVLYLPMVNEDGTTIIAPTRKKEPIMNLKIGDKIKLAYPKEGYQRSMDNYLLLMDYEKYRDLYVSKEVIITGIIEDLPVEGIFYLGGPDIPNLLMAVRILRNSQVWKDIVTSA